MTSVPFSPSRRGRPPKYGRPSRAVTLTLPEDVIAALARLDEDLGRAVVRIAQPLVADVVPHAPAELSNYGDSAVILTRRLPSLSRIPGVTLVPLPDGRALISLDGTMSVSDFELKLRDMVDDASPLDPAEKSALEAIARILKAARSTKGLAVHERSIIVLQSTNHRPIAREIA
jgi:hypothetical protein